MGKINEKSTEVHMISNLFRVHSMVLSDFELLRIKGPEGGLVTKIWKEEKKELEILRRAHLL